MFRLSRPDADRLSGGSYTIAQVGAKRCVCGGGPNGSGIFASKRFDPFDCSRNGVSSQKCVGKQFCSRWRLQQWQCHKHCQAFGSGRRVSSRALIDHKIGHKQLLPMHGGLPPFTSYSLASSQKRVGMETTGNVANNGGFKINALHDSMVAKAGKRCSTEISVG